jgi:hypothetical protein
MSEIERLRLLHDVTTRFDVPEQVTNDLARQLTDDDRSKIDRFISGFEIENWFEAIFSVMPWSMLIHGLSQKQFPLRSKAAFQVPDFLAIVETTSLCRKPILVEVKRVTNQKQTLKLGNSQLALTQEYASCLGLPIVYVIYWDKLQAWTANTPDSFERGTSSQRLRMLRAFEFDCSLIFGDVSFLIMNPLSRVRTFTRSSVDSPAFIHRDFGNCVLDKLMVDGKSYELTSLESSTLDSVIPMNQIEVAINGDITRCVEGTDDRFVVKLSNWITRHLAIYGLSPEERHANVFANVISEFTKRVGIPTFNVFPWGRTPEIKALEAMCFRSKGVK